MYGIQSAAMHTDSEQSLENVCLVVQKRLAMQGILGIVKIFGPRGPSGELAIFVCRRLAESRRVHSFGRD